MKPHHIKLAKAIVAFAIANDLVVHQINKKRCNRNAEIARNLKAENEQLHAELHTSIAKIDYLVKKLVENDISASEFDLIVFNSLIQ